MLETNFFARLNAQRKQQRKTFLQFLHLDGWLLTGLLMIITYGITVLISSSDQNIDMISGQLSRFAFAFIMLFIAAQIRPELYRMWVPYVYFACLFLLVVVLLVGYTGKGAQRWLVVGPIRFQPSEIMKIAVPMMVAWYLGEKPLPPRSTSLFVCGLIIVAPVLLIAKQPDLGTAIMIAIAGGSVILFAGMSWRLLTALSGLAITGLPLLWFLMHDYQRQRVLTFLNPNRDPLGAGYHIIQSKIAIGSGGFWGKGWFNGTQSHLDFLPEHSTDFIFSVIGEEFGLFGAFILLLIYFFIVGRALQIAYQAHDTFTRLLAGGIAFSFFFSAFVNIGMVMGILPVVGIPLPLVSYGGTAVVTMLTGFGILMSIHTHKTTVRGYI